MRFSCLALFVAFVAICPAEARAHLGLDVPASRYGPDTLKTGPCGVAGGERTTNVTYYEPGETIEVRWNEYVDHRGHYRIAFDDDGDDDFVDPATMMELYSNDTVLLDEITDNGQGERDYVATVTLPELSCDNCTLQVIQVMYDKPPYTTPGNDIYYQCADLVLREAGTPPDAGTDAGTDVGTDAGTDADGGPRVGAEPGTNASGGCSVRNGTIAELGVFPLLLLLVLSRLARRQRLLV
ncbi:MAG: SCE4755 family polysaccharide monooxygenase-like protein [Polyangiales bacterium]